jgi:1,4-alpha-glucan branching enzyme
MMKITKKSKTTAHQSEPVKAQASAAQPVTAQPQTPVSRPAVLKAQASAPKPVTAEVAKAPAPRTNRVSLQLVRPGARQVFVAGSFNEWKPERTPLLHRGNGCWVGDLAVGAGRHEYLFVVDGQWVPDPNAKESVQNPFGGKNSLLVVSE